jgi:hypothetical protein
MKNATIKQLRAEFKCYGKVELGYDVYCDRVVFLGYNDFVITFFNNRNVFADYDRGGISIDRKDAENLGFDLSKNEFWFQCKDLRKTAPTYAR